LLARTADVVSVPRDQRITRTGDVLREELADALGRPLDDVRLYFIDSHRNPVRRSVRSYQRQLAPVRSDHRSDNFVVAPFVAAVKVPGGWSVLRREETAPFTSWTQRMLLVFAASLVAATPLAWLFARRFAAPFAEFAEAAGRLGRDPGAPPLERIRGPAEVQTAAAAFNDMQGRLNRYVHDRTAMVGAIAHDLRTPLTRLRFRVESAPPALAAKMTSDIEQMEQMIADTMAFVRDATHQGERCKLELFSLVQTVADEMADTGLDVSSDGRAPVVVYGDALALRRLVSNLLDNAVKFGARARARVYAEAGLAVVEVDDDGPGVPERDRERLFEPFHRGEPSRNRSTGGAGLGLAVVRTIARAHGGEAELENRPEGGLRARARLPLHLQVA
jgi:signal transduction histidine kinase